MTVIFGEILHLRKRLIKTWKLLCIVAIVIQPCFIVVSELFASEIQTEVINCNTMGIKVSYEPAGDPSKFIFSGKSQPSEGRKKSFSQFDGGKMFSVSGINQDGTQISSDCANNGSDDEIKDMHDYLSHLPLFIGVAVIAAIFCTIIIWFVIDPLIRN